MATFAARVIDLVVAIRTKINSMMPRLLPTGGSIGQVLFKSGSADGAAAWATPSFSAVKTATLTIPFPGAYEHTQTVADTAVGVSDRLQAWLAPTADSDENDPELLDLVTLTAQAGNDSVTFTITFSEITSGDILVFYRNPAAL